MQLRISAILQNEDSLQSLINKLIQQSVARHDISVQSHSKTETPDIAQQSDHPNKQEPFLDDDFGWVLGYSFSIPLFLGLIIGIFLIGDVRSLTDNFFYGTVGGIVGGIVGLMIANLIKNRHQHLARQQENEGGFVIWITLHNEEHKQEVLATLDNYAARNVTLEPLPG